MNIPFGIIKLLCKTALIVLAFVSILVFPTRAFAFDPVDTIINDEALQEKIAECDMEVKSLKLEKSQASNELSDLEAQYKIYKSKIGLLKTKGCNKEGSPCFAEYMDELELSPKQDIDEWGRDIERLNDDIAHRETECKGLRELANLNRTRGNTAGGKRLTIGDLALIAEPGDKVEIGGRLNLRVTGLRTNESYEFRWYIDGKMTNTITSAKTVEGKNPGAHEIVVDIWNKTGSDYKYIGRLTKTLTVAAFRETGESDSTDCNQRCQSNDYVKKGTYAFNACVQNCEECNKSCRAKKSAAAGTDDFNACMSYCENMKRKLKKMDPCEACLYNCGFDKYPNCSKKCEIYCSNK
jgi:hypothetical protein